MRYDIEVTFKRGKMKDKTLKASFNMVYSDKDYIECENMIRDELKTIGDRFINQEFYS